MSSTMAIQQQIGMLNVERIDREIQLGKAEHALAAENTKRTRKAAQDLIERLSAIDRQVLLLTKQLATSVTSMSQSEETKTTRVDRRPKVNGKTIGCRDCTAEFLVGTSELAFYAEKGLAEPTRCRDCRAQKKAARPQPQTLECYDCQANFEFSVASQRFFEDNGWVAPTRCSPCRISHKAAKPLRINCDRCHNHFSFSSDAQKDFKAKGWEIPLRCRECRPLHKAEYAAKMAAEAEAAALAAKAATDGEVVTAPSPAETSSDTAALQNNVYLTMINGSIDLANEIIEESTQALKKPLSAEDQSFHERRLEGQTAMLAELKASLNKD